MFVVPPPPCSVDGASVSVDNEGTVRVCSPSEVSVLVDSENENSISVDVSTRVIVAPGSEMIEAGGPPAHVPGSLPQPDSGSQPECSS